MIHLPLALAWSYLCLRAIQQWAQCNSLVCADLSLQFDAFISLILHSTIQKLHEMYAFHVIQATFFSSEIPEISKMLLLYFINHHLKRSKMCCHSYKHFAGHQIDKGRSPKFDFIVHWTGRSYRNLSKLRVVEYIFIKGDNAFAHFWLSFPVQACNCWAFVLYWELGMHHK